MSYLSRKTFFHLLILFYFSIYSYSFEISEDDPQLPIAKIVLNCQNLEDIEKILISKLLSGAKVPQIILSKNIPFLGNINLTLYDNLLTLSTTSDADIEFVEEDNLNLITNNIQGYMTFNYKFDSKLIDSIGNGTIIIKNLVTKINNTIVQFQNEHEINKSIPGIQIDSIHIDDIEMEYSLSNNRTFEKLIKYFYKNMKDFLLNVLRIELKKEEVILNINEQLEKIFKNLYLNVPIKLEGIDSNLNFSFSINEKPIIQDNFLELSLEGEIKGDNYIYEINNISIPSIINNTTLITDNSINSIISQFIFNNVLDLLYYFGKLSTEITNNTLNISILNVGIISGIIPEILREYKANQRIKLMTNAISSPILNINAQNQIKINLNQSLKIFVYNESSFISDIGTIPVEAETTLEIFSEFYANDKEIILKIKSIEMLTFVVKKSLIGEINESNVIKNFNRAVKSYLSLINKNIKNTMNDIKQKMINYHGINLSNSFTNSFDDYIKVDITPILVSLFDLYYY